MTWLKIRMGMEDDSDIFCFIPKWKIYYDSSFEPSQLDSYEEESQHKLLCRNMEN